MPAPTSRKPYPDECPVFMVLSDGPAVRRGALVEGLGAEATGIDPVTKVRLVNFRPRIAARVLVEADWICDLGQRTPEGWGGVVLVPEHVRPLTRAAREMLALVEGR